MYYEYFMKFIQVINILHTAFLRTADILKVSSLVRLSQFRLIIRVKTSNLL